MSGDHARGTRARRVGITVGAVGLIATALASFFANQEVDRVERRSVDRAAEAALVKVQSLSASVDQVLATANGVVAASSFDPERFVQVLGPDIEASGSLAGMALLENRPTGTTVVSTIGATPLLLGHEAGAAAAGTTSQLVAWERTDAGYRLGFAAAAARGDGAVFLEVELPIEAAARGQFALADRASSGAAPVVGNVGSVDGMKRWATPVALGGKELTLFVHAATPSTGVLGISLPIVILVLGLALTAAAVALAVALVRRNEAVASLGAENRALDEALAYAHTVEVKLRASEERFRSILRNTPDVIATVDPARGSCEILNRTDFLGHPLDELREDDGVLTLIHPDDMVAAAAYFGQLYALDPDQVSETLLRVADAGGDDRHVRFRFSVLRVGDDEMVLIGLISDITDDRHQQLREAELEESLRRSQRLDSVGQLASGVAHDFNNLLSAILSCAELLVEEPLEPRVHEYAADIERAATRGATLVRQLLAFGQRDDARPRTVDLNEVLNDMEPLLARTLGERVQLQLVTSEDPSTILADPVHIEQVVLNLALNGRDAMPDGGVLFVAATTDGARGDQVVLSVTDTGTGIDPEIQEAMFEPFFTTKEAGTGTGLGLATVASIVESAGATIDVTSAAGQGTTFEIAFPSHVVDEPEVPVEEPARPEQEPDRTGRRVLLVEDDPAVRSALAATLQQHAFAVTAVASAQEALRALDIHATDVVITDAVMPVMSGMELLTQIRATRPVQPIILMSGYSRDLFDRDGPMGDVPVLRKPFTNRVLFETIYGALERREEGQPA